MSSEISLSQDANSANNPTANAIESEREKDKVKDKENMLDKVRRNVEKLKEVKKNEGGSFLRFQPGEVKILQFTGDMEPVQRTFKNKKDDGKEEKNEKIMYAYKVLDMQDQDKGIQVWEVSRSWSDNIDNLLVKGFLTLEVKREGAGTSTSYLFAPAVSAANTNTKGP